MAAKLKIMPIGGLGEVGKNMMSIEYGRNILVVDAGMMFPELDMLGIDYIIPDWGYLRDKKDLVRAIVITHVTRITSVRCPTLCESSTCRFMPRA